MMSWLERCAGTDVAVFRWINDGLFWPPLAAFVHGVARDRLLLGALLLAGAAYAWTAGWARALRLGVWSALAIALSNAIHNQFLKPFFNRPRPYVALDQVHLSAPLGNLAALSTSFPSTHAASAAALAVLVGGLDPRLTWPAWALALGVGFGTVYSGGHYPLDVAGGFAVGAGLGWLLLRLNRIIEEIRARAAGRRA